MDQKIAVIVIHGIGRQKENFADPFTRLLLEQYAKETGEKHPEQHLAIEPVYWAKVLEEREEALKRNIVRPYQLRYQWLRHFVIHYLADAVAYQPLGTNDQTYQAIHETISAALHRLSEVAGANAPLCVVSYSLGAVIASNYFYDLQNANGWKPVIFNPDSALERGDTLLLFYSCGTTLPLWSLRYLDFDKPIRVPSRPMRELSPDIEGEWINFYDKDDILAYPLRGVHPAYADAVREDIEVHVGNWITGWNPFSHSGYFASDRVVGRMAEGLAKAWRQTNRLA
ncbi:chemotaxis protein [Paenibacillus cisolokensis]|uniref:chemotaxis protein n=1 Tax=Paenibacillus cisolokensis TaxID=1658519 RepID=UPI003D2C32A4